MAVDLKKFKKRVEKKLPILFLVEESNLRDAADVVRRIIDLSILRNIHSEMMLITYGLDWTLRYPSLKGADAAPCFVGLEGVDVNDVYSRLRMIREAPQTFLGSALELSKAILDDPETVLPDRYKPVVVIMSSRTPAKGWEEKLNALMNEGRSSQAQIFWVSADDKEESIENFVKIFHTELFLLGAVAAAAKGTQQPKSLDGSAQRNGRIFNVRGLGTYNTEEISKKVVDAFKLEPLDEAPVEQPPEVEPVDFDAPGFEGSFGDGTSAKGDGVI